MEEEVTAVQAAKLTGCSDRTIRRMIKDKQLPARQIASNRYAIKVSDLTKLSRRGTGQGELKEVLTRLAVIEERLGRIEALLTSERAYKQIAPPVHVLREPPRPAPVTETPAPGGLLTLQQLAAALGVADSTVRTHLKEKHYESTLQGKHYFTPEQTEQARAYHAAHPPRGKK